MRTKCDIGAWGELLVAADLLRRNYEVFRNISPNGLADLIASRGGKTIRIQVKVGSYGYPGQTAAYDVLARVDKDGKVLYYGAEIEGAVPRTRCIAKLLQGPEQCRKTAVPGQDYCHSHLASAKASPVENPRLTWLGKRFGVRGPKRK